LEKAFFKLYRTQNDEESFSDLVAIFGKRYPLLAYLFLLKDRSKYLPIRPTHFDRVFELLGVDLKTSHRCSWENYREFIQVIAELRTLLFEQLNVEVSLLDAHSFAWILSSQMQNAGKLPDVTGYLSLPASEREAIVMARIGQGRFRSQLLNYWSGCAVTGCREPKLLRASHIKPWSESSLQERTDLFNGLLLSPTLDTAFDAGFITFDENGRILISDLLSNDDATALGIHPEMKVHDLDDRHKKYLDHHRREVFKDGES
jgi:predicted restriction endonuclease